MPDAVGALAGSAALSSAASLTAALGMATPCSTPQFSGLQKQNCAEYQNWHAVCIDLSEALRGASFPLSLADTMQSPSHEGLFFAQRRFPGTFTTLSYAPVQNRTKSVQTTSREHQSRACHAPLQPVYACQYRQITYFSLPFKEMQELACSLLKTVQE
jgi:hypothetical protein